MTIIVQSLKERERESLRHICVQLLKLLLQQIRGRSDFVDRRGFHLARSSDLLLCPFRWSSQGKKRVTQGKESEHSLIFGASRNVSQSSIVIHAKHAAFEVAVVSKKLLRSTGKAAWIANTTFLILAVPLIIKTDRDQQLTEINLQNASLLAPLPLPIVKRQLEDAGIYRREMLVRDRHVSLVASEKETNTFSLSAAVQ
ncbi:mitochondrial import receptor subunit tom9-2 [Quercus suber]|uniref:Mitochondrial import receptor subunit tom9-2 n=1 Tax=Quercus suber TaxID=58331 RepID=A0AAW0JAK4_QUESU